MKAWQWAGAGVAAFAATVSLINASWLAPTPRGRLIMVAHRGVAQPLDRTGLGRNDCTAAHMLPSDHDYIENTLRSMRAALSLGAGLIELDVHPTRDGAMVVFHDWTLDCRTNGAGPVREKTLAELKKLDIGYGYTADGGRSFPLRGHGVGAMPTVEEVLREFPGVPLLFNFKSRDPADADALAAAFRRAGAAIGPQYSYYGDPAPLGRMRRYAPHAWMWDRAGVKACARDYLLWGWTSIVPQNCRNGTIVVPLNYRWAIWGWPYRFLDRMANNGTRVIVMGEVKDSSSPVGIERPEQLGEVPRDFRGYLWVENMYDIGRARGR